MNKKNPTALIVCGDGINCEVETQYALQLVGFNCKQQSATDLLQTKNPFSGIRLLVIPGGFAFGDEIASGKVLALKLKQKIFSDIRSFVDSGNLVMGTCNGFQVLTQLGILPFSEPSSLHKGRLAKNAGGKFINRWVTLKVNENHPSLFFEGLHTFDLPIRHGEGKLELSDELTDSDLKRISRQAALAYTENVNGSFNNIAALTNESGNVMGIMPHPEAFVRQSQHPAWTENTLQKSHQNENAVPAGLRIFQNVYRACLN